ncbi:hypothetical protein V9L05_14350 [Bernardetia sp. Wsw4-3y2]|uniref:hypothetical protein n=1 Tax=Bernardetia sp. Wsw4-3y2 TaxID=3127471 RepID=UPI0030D5BE18
MKTKIINSLLVFTCLVALFFVVKDYFLMEKVKPLHQKYKEKYLESYVVESNQLNKIITEEIIKGNDLPINTSFIFRDTINSESGYLRNKDYRTFLLFRSLDSVLTHSLEKREWKKNKNKLKSIFTYLTLNSRYDTLKMKTDYYDLDSIFKNKEINDYGWAEIYYASNDFKSNFISSFGCFCSGFSHYGLLPIPSKSTVQVGDTISINWVNFYSDFYMIPETYRFSSNYDKYKLVDNIYDDAILLQEYQIPFSEIEKDKKWRSVFYFRNDKLEQDSVVLERELEF